MKKTLTKIFNIIKYIFFTLLVIYIIFILIQRISGNKSILGYRIFTIATGSMEPVYKVNDIILVKDIDTNALEIGDDIVYRGNRAGLEGKIISHRIINLDKGINSRVEKIYTKGINTTVEDPSISPEQVLGKVDSKIPVITLINHIIKNKFGFFFLVICPLVLVIYLEIIETIIGIKLDKRELIDRKSKKGYIDEEII